LRLQLTLPAPHMASTMMSARLGAPAATASRRSGASQRAAAAVPVAPAPLAASKSAVMTGAASGSTAALRAVAGRRGGVAAHAGVRTPVAQAASSESKFLGVSVTTMKKVRPRASALQPP
jgi:hypothetical protein